MPRRIRPGFAAGQALAAVPGLWKIEPSQGILDHQGVTVTWAGRRKAAVYMN